ncbi:predicted protein [Sclerotinia sclerotiorum 1980 UF-70]|uniref:Uncharacterized protein n=1 Tax=Sclerotinia sclerotiorum (strain ATCC 18683 / 1980 / Ss-1) TaxID=665079 RepID=A7EH20_SCLS1|nr:predicted protein [Sclerotinia sclerotiorum 1980 UF-70]EDO02136.1 predicted protein [Sclerotinia sclerotiorum 1980 UF-70]
MVNEGFGPNCGQSKAEIFQSTDKKIDRFEFKTLLLEGFRIVAVNYLVSCLQCTVGWIKPRIVLLHFGAAITSAQRRGGSVVVKEAEPQSQHDTAHLVYVKKPGDDGNIDKEIDNEKLSRLENVEAIKNSTYETSCCGKGFRTHCCTEP